MQTLLSIVLLSITTCSLGQTDIIEMKSRNASLKKYKRTFHSSDNDHALTNFGMAPMPEIRTAVLDSVKAISDSVSVVYTSNYCSRGYQPLDVELFIDSNEVQREVEKPTRIYPKPRVGRLWKPGADTVTNHPIFTKRHSLDSVKEVIDRSYHFNLPSDSIRFIGFDNASKIMNEDSVQPVKHKRQKKNSFGWELVFMILTPILFLLGMHKFMTSKVLD